MNQPEFQDDWLSSYFDGEELTPAERLAVQQRLATSSESEQLLQDFHSLSGLLKELPVETAPAELIDQIRQQVIRSAPSRSSQPLKTSQLRHSTSRWYWFAGAGTLVASLLLMTTLYDRFNSPTADELLVMNSPPAALERPNTVLMLPRTDNLQAGLSENATLGLEIDSIPATENEVVAPAPTGAPATMMAASAIPALPPLTPLGKAELMAELADSPKLQGKLQPGELIRYIKTDQDELAVVELSVVDIRKNLGEIEVLLASNGFNTVEQNLVLNSSQNRPAQNEALNGQINNKASEPFAQPDSELRLQVTEPDSELFVLLQETNGMIGLYVEGTDQQVLQAINQLQTLEAVKTVNIGAAPALVATTYQLAPVTRRTATNNLNNAAHPTNPLNQRIPFYNDHNFSYLPPAEESSRLLVENSSVDTNGDSRGLRMRYQNRPNIPALATKDATIGSAVAVDGQQTKAIERKQDSGLKPSTRSEKSERPILTESAQPGHTAGDFTGINRQQFPLAQQMPVLITPVPQQDLPQATDKKESAADQTELKLAEQRVNSKMSVREKMGEQQLANRSLKAERADQPVIPQEQRTRVLLVLIPSAGQP